MFEESAHLEDKIRNRSATVAVVGLGYVGLPLAVAFGEVGYPVVGVDVDPSKVAAIGRGESYIGDVTSERIAALLAGGRLTATTGYGWLHDADVIFVCVPTPFDNMKTPDLSYVRAASNGIAEQLRRGQLVVLQSTTFPGTTEEEVLPILERSALRAGIDFHLAFSPERINPGDAKHTVFNTPKVVGGFTPRCAHLTAELLATLNPEVRIVSSPRVAEMTKLLENIFRSVNIALVNELALLSERMGIDIWEVIDAASTKPFGFMPFYPGPGVGGHCLAPGEYLAIKNGMGMEIVPIGEYFERALDQGQWSVYHHIDGVTLIKPDDVEVLTFDPEEGKASFHPLRYLSARRYEGRMIQIVTQDGRRLVVTDGHPIVVWTDEGTLVKRADALKPGDQLAVFKTLADDPEPPPAIDLIAHLAPDDYEGLRVKPLRESFATYRSQLVPHLRGRLTYYWDVFRYNTMPLSVYVALEQDGAMPIPREDVVLCTGHGASYGSIPAVFPLNEDLARLIGYYLSEGCMTEDKTLRTRFTFRCDEHEMIEDLKAILSRLGLKFSTYQDHQWKSFHIKVSSRLFGILLRDILACGTNSYNMRIPSLLLLAPKNLRLALLSGLLRGDGDVHHIQEERTYTKRGRRYTHAINTATVGYFSASPMLFQQMVFLLHSLGFVPTFKHSKPQLRLYGATQLGRIAPLLTDEKRRRLEAFEQGRRKRMPTTQSRDQGDFATIAVREVLPANDESVVYSLEVDSPHLFVTSYGLVVHNCIPVDPFYLSWKAREYDFTTKFIELAADVNQEMPPHVVNKVTEALNRRGKPLRGARVLILGVAFKPDVDDPRNSPAQRIIELLLERGTHIAYHDPYVPRFQVGNDVFHRDPVELESITLTEGALSDYDCAVIVAGHRWYDYNWVVQHARLIVDCVNATAGIPDSDGKVVRLGAPADLLTRPQASAQGTHV